MRESRAVVVVLLLALSAAGVLALRRSIHPPTANRHGLATALSAEPVGEDGSGNDAVALRPSLEKTPWVEPSRQRQSLRAVLLPGRDPIPVRHCKLPSDDDDPFARG
jgi:hypothetical protein